MSNFNVIINNKQASWSEVLLGYWTLDLWPLEEGDWMIGFWGFLHIPPKRYIPVIMGAMLILMIQPG